MNNDNLTFMNTYPAVVSMGFTVLDKMNYICPRADSISEVTYSRSHEYDIGIIKSLLEEVLLLYNIHELVLLGNLFASQPACSRFARCSKKLKHAKHR